LRLYPASSRKLSSIGREGCQVESNKSTSGISSLGCILSGLAICDDEGRYGFEGISEHPFPQTAPSRGSVTPRVEKGLRMSYQSAAWLDAGWDPGEASKPHGGGGNPTVVDTHPPSPPPHVVGPRASFRQTAEGRQQLPLNI